MPMIKETVIELADCGQNFKQFYVDGNNFVTDADLPPISSPGMMRHSPGFGF
jgi:hypothetical protein